MILQKNLNSPAIGGHVGNFILNIDLLTPIALLQAGDNGITVRNAKSDLFTVEIGFVGEMLQYCVVNQQTRAEHMTQRFYIVVDIIKNS